jgi:hypothetical protein
VSPMEYVTLRWVSWLIVALLGVYLPTAKSASASDLIARVKILTMDSFGQSFGKSRVTLFKGEHGRDLSNRFIGDMANGIPFGQYMARVETESGGWVTRSVVVDRDDCLLIFAENPVTIESGPGMAPVLHGEISTFSGQVKRPAWVKLCGLYLDGCSVASVDASNRFSFVDIIPGEFLVSVLCVSGHIMTERVNVTRPDLLLVLDPMKTGADRVETRSPK